MCCTMTRLKEGLVEVYTGNGKGKTTAALGLAVRAIGRGLKVYVIQFIKGGFDYGELYALENLQNITLRAFGRGRFVRGTPPEEEDIKLAQAALDFAKEVVGKGKYDVVILDEVNVALNLCLIKLDEVVKLIRTKPKNVELVLTGRDAPKELIEVADLTTEMVEIKHPFNRGLKARRGIEF